MANYSWAKNKPTFCPLLRLTAFPVSLLLIIFPIKINIKKRSSLQEAPSSVFQEMQNLEEIPKAALAVVLLEILKRAAEREVSSLYANDPADNG